MLRARVPFTFTIVALFAGCTEEAVMPDAGMDTGTPMEDAGLFDAFVPMEDGGRDAGPETDGGPSCGNGMLDTGEECDDGNIFPGDGCSPTCTQEPVCGNDELEAGEGCDDGNRMAGDGCSATCAIEEQCGDGAPDAGEECDDGNTMTGDGCDASCMREPRCGDGELDSGEMCDDGNNEISDGCDASCAIEPDVCGDGTLQAWAEQCDDMNLDPGDGCNGSCDVEGTCANPIDLATAGTATPTGFHFIGQNNASARDNGSGSCRTTLGGLDRVFTFTPTRTGRMTVSTGFPATSYDTVLHVRTGCSSLPTERACDDNGGGGTRSRVVIDVTAGVPVFIFADARVTTTGMTGTSAMGTFELDVSVVGTSGEDGPCDPAGVTILCQTGLLCAPDGAGGHTCQSDADLGCGVNVPIVDLTPLFVRGRATFSGDTRTSMNRTRGSCSSSTNTAPEIFHRFVLPYDAKISVQLSPGFDASMYLRTMCTDTASEQICTDDPEVVSPVDLGVLTAGTEIFVVVDGYSSAANLYTLSVTFVRELPDGSACDPAHNGDLCIAPALCAPSGGGNTCQQGVDLGCGIGVPVVDLTSLLTPTGSITYSGDTSTSTHRIRPTGGCTSSTSVAPEIAHRLIMPYDADLRISADPAFDEVIYVRTSCTTATSQRFCSDSPTVSYTTGGFYTAGTEIFVFMDGYFSDSLGPYPLFVQLRRRSQETGPCGAGADDPQCAAGLVCRTEPGGSVCRRSFCGDGVVEGSEQCDDANMVSMDGCSMGCTIETIGAGGDACGDAVRLNLVRTGATTHVGRGMGSTAAAMADLTGYCSTTGAAPDQVYVFGFAERSDLVITLTPSGGFDGALYIRGGLMRACDDASGEAYCRDGAAANGAETIRLNGVPAGTYYAVIDGVGTTMANRGAYTIEVRATAAPAPP